MSNPFANLDATLLEPISLLALATVVGGDRVVTPNDVRHQLLNAWDQYAAGMKYTTKASIDQLNQIKTPVRRF